jgi:transposase
MAARQERSKPISKQLEIRLKASRARVSAKSLLGNAPKYIAKFRGGLCLFRTAGRVELDINSIQRPIVLNRQNALFARHDAEARNRAMFASLIETCKLNAVDPHAWLTPTLQAIVNEHKQSRIDELPPRNSQTNM